MSIKVSQPASRLVTSLARRSLSPATALAMSFALLACAQAASPMPEDSATVAATQSSALLADTVLDTSMSVDAPQCCPTWDDVCDIIGGDEASDESAFLMGAGATILTSATASPGAAAPAGLVAAKPPTIRRCWNAIVDFFCKVEVDGSTGKTIEKCEIPEEIRKTYLGEEHRRILGCVNPSSEPALAIKKLAAEMAKLRLERTATRGVIESTKASIARRQDEIKALEASLKDLAVGSAERAQVQKALDAARIEQELDKLVLESLNDALADINSKLYWLGEKLRETINQCGREIGPTP